MKKVLYLLLLVSVGAGAADPAVQARARAAEALPRVIYNNDGGDAYLYPADREFSIAGFLALRTTSLTGTAVGAISYCTITSSFGQFTHPTKYGEFLDGPHHRPRVRNVTAEFAKLGTDPLREEIRFAREHGLKIFWSNRMNDTHDASHREDKPSEHFSKLKREHPEYLFGAIGERKPFGVWSAVDYARPEIRELAVRFFAEVAENYDVDGVEMDFCRHFHLFKRVSEGEFASDAEREMLLDMVRRIRRAVDAAAAKRGRPILISMRVPDSPEFCRLAGLDVEAICREHLVDAVIGGGYFHFRPWKKFAEFARKYGVRSYANISEPRLVKVDPLLSRRDAMVWRARAAAALAHGVDGIYIFNQFGLRRAEWAYATELRDPEAMMRKNKYYLATYLGTRGASQLLKNALTHNELPGFFPQSPRTLDGRLDVPFETAERVTPQAVYVLVESLPADALEIRLNGRAVEFAGRRGNVTIWRAAPEALEPLDNVVTLSGKAKLFDCGLLAVHDPGDNNRILRSLLRNIKKGLDE